MGRIEKQNTEFKESWREEHLKTLCAFANTKGGDLLIGIDDAGKPKGLADKKKLLEDIPNKIKEALNVLADVQPRKKTGRDYVHIKIKPYDAPISFKGKHYIRSGSTTQELSGTELHQFLLSKSSMAWESVIDDKATLTDINEKQLAKFRDLAKEHSRAPARERTTPALLAKLHLAEKGRLNRAGLLLFGKNPQQHVPGSFVKVGKFSNGEELISGEEIKGNLFAQAEQVLEVLKNKYLVSEVEIKGLYRTESLEYPESALREALVNAIAHKDYSGAHIQIKVYPDKLTFWNPGTLPQGLTIALLKKTHPSKPRNEHIATVLYAAGLIERWGQGTVKMVRECVKAGMPEPAFEELGGGILVTFTKDAFNEEHLAKKGLNERQIKGILHIKKYGSISNNDYQQITGAIKRTASRDLTELSEKGFLHKAGSTGKGTVYMIRGHKGDKGDIKGTQRGQTKTLNVLDNKLLQLEKELSVLDPNEEIKDRFDRPTFFKIYDSWLSELLEKVILIAQKFNPFFAEIRHLLIAINGYWTVEFRNENPKMVLKDYREKASKNDQAFANQNLIVQLALGYLSFKKAGLKTFGCNYTLEIVFTSIGYKIYLGESSSGFTESRERLEVENLLHKKLSAQEIASICEKLGEQIYAQIEEKRNSLKK